MLIGIVSARRRRLSRPALSDISSDIWPESDVSTVRMELLSL